MKKSFNAVSGAVYDVDSNQTVLKVGAKNVSSVLVDGNIRQGDAMSPLAIFNLSDFLPVESITKDGLYEIPICGLAQIKFTFASGTIAVTVI